MTYPVGAATEGLVGPSAGGGDGVDSLAPFSRRRPSVLRFMYGASVYTAHEGSNG